MDILGDRSAVPVHGCPRLRQMGNPFRQPVIFALHQGSGPRGTFDIAGVIIRKGLQIVVPVDVRHALCGGQQVVLVLRLGALLQSVQKILVYPLTQTAGHRSGFVPLPPPAVTAADEQAVEGQTQGQKSPQGGQAGQLVPLVSQQPHTCPSR